MGLKFTTWSKMESREMKPILITTLTAVLLLGCDPHVDSVYLGRDESSMLGDVSAGNIVAVKEYLDKGGDPNAVTIDGSTLLTWAAAEQEWTLLRRLVDGGANAASVVFGG